MNMAAETRSIEKKEILRNRRLRVFGLNNSILSDTTVYFNPLKETHGDLSIEEAAMYDAVTKYFNESDS